ncbi:MAG: hypothetical protein MJ252_15420 [archaeon]|nr:hypothetical protein [archaeon]
MENKKEEAKVSAENEEEEGEYTTTSGCIITTGDDNQNQEKIEKEDQITELQHKIIYLEKANMELKKTNEKLLSGKNNITNSPSKSAPKKSEIVNETINENKSVKEGNADNKTDINKLKKDYEELDKQNAEMLQLLEEFQQENEELRKEKESIAQNLQMQIDDLTKKYNELLEEKQRIETEGGNEDYELTMELQNEFELYKQSMDDKFAEHEQNIKMYKEQIEQLTDENQRIKDTLDLLQMDKIQLMNLIKSKENETDQEKNEFLALQNQVTELKKEINKKIKQKDEMDLVYREKISEMERNAEVEAEKLKKKIESVQDELNDVKKENVKYILGYASLSKECSNAKKREEKAKNDLEVSQNKLRDAFLIFEKKKEEFRRMNDNANLLAKSKDKKIAELEEKVKNLCIEKQTLIEGKSMKRSRTTGNLNFLDESDYESNYDEDNEEMEELRKENRKLNEDLRDCKDKLLSFELEYKDLLNELKGLIKGTGKKLPEPKKIEEEKNSEEEKEYTPKELLEYYKQIIEEERQNTSDQIDLLQIQIAENKAIMATQSLENEKSLSKYKKLIKQMFEVCKDKGISFSFEQRP